MTTDKEKLDALLTLSEEMYLQACAMRALLEKLGVANWRDSLGNALGSEEANHLRGQFHEMYQEYLGQYDPDDPQVDSLEFLRKVRIFGKIQ